MIVEDAVMKLCPFTDTQKFHNNPDISYCVAGSCMAWVYTNEYSKEACQSSQKLPENDKEGYCSLAKR